MIQGEWIGELTREDWVAIRRKSEELAATDDEPEIICTSVGYVEVSFDGVLAWGRWLPQAEWP